MTHASLLVPSHPALASELFVKQCRDNGEHVLHTSSIYHIYNYIYIIYNQHDVFTSKHLSVVTLIKCASSVTQDGTVLVQAGRWGWDQGVASMLFGRPYPLEPPLVEGTIRQTSIWISDKKKHLISVFRCWHLSHLRVSKPYDIIWCHILSDCHVHLRDCHIANSKTVPQPSALQERPITPRGVQAGYRTVIITGWPILEDFTGFPWNLSNRWTVRKTVLSFQCQIFDICNILQTFDHFRGKIWKIYENLPVSSIEFHDKILVEFQGRWPRWPRRSALRRCPGNDSQGDGKMMLDDVRLLDFMQTICFSFMKNIFNESGSVLNRIWLVLSHIII